MTRATILEENIEDKLWPERVLIMTYIKNSHLTKALANNLTPHKIYFCEKPHISYMQILSSMYTYFFI